MKPQPSVPERNTGTPTTNHTSRAPKRKKRAAESTFTSGLLESSPRKAAFAFARPSSRGSVASVSSHTAASAAAIAHSAPRKPSSDSSSPPRKKPAPLSAFFEPVSSATHLKSAPSASGGTSTLMELFALILVRSFATPLSACVPIT